VGVVVVWVVDCGVVVEICAVVVVDCGVVVVVVVLVELLEVIGEKVVRRRGLLPRRPLRSFRWGLPISFNRPKIFG